MSDSQLAAFRSRTMGFIFQAYNLLPVLTALENVELPLLLVGLPSRSGGSARRRPSASSAWTTAWATIPGSSPAARSSASPSRAPS